MNKSILCGFVLFILLVAGGACKKAAQNEGQGEQVVRIGEVQTLTGGEAGIGIAIHQGIELAVQKLNAQGGVQGRKIKLITLDDQGKPDEAATAVTKLITQDRVSAILGASASSRSIAIAAIAQRHHVPMVTPTSTHPKVTEMGDFIFRVCFIDPFQGQVMANFANRALKAKRVAILTDLKSDYSVGLTEFFANTVKANGGEVIGRQSYSAGDVDFKSQLTALRAKSPQAIFIPGYYSDVALIARQARDLGISIPLLGGDGWSSPKLMEIAGRAIENSYFSSHFASESKDPETQRFVADYKGSYGSVPNGLSALGFDAAGFLVEALKRASQANDMNSLNVRQILAGMANYSGITGKISMNPDRNAIKSATIIKIEDGHFKYHSTIDPE